MSIRDRMIDVIVADAEGSADAVRALATKVVDAQLAACPEIAALDHAVEGFLTNGPGGWWAATPDPLPAAKRVLVVDAPEAPS